VKIRHSPATVSGYESFEHVTVLTTVEGWEGKKASRHKATKSGNLPDCLPEIFPCAGREKVRNLSNPAIGGIFLFPP